MGLQSSRAHLLESGHDPTNRTDAVPVPATEICPSEKTESPVAKQVSGYVGAEHRSYVSIGDPLAVIGTPVSIGRSHIASSPEAVRLAARFRVPAQDRWLPVLSSHIDGLADVGRGEGAVRCCREGLPPRCAAQRFAGGRVVPWALSGSTSSATAARSIQSAYSVLVQRCSRTSVR
jgi:hypothetical protein